MNNEKLDDIAFKTKRLKIFNWRLYQTDISQLSQAVKCIITETTLKTLPPSWNTPNDDESRKSWILEREKESICLAACDRVNNEIVGVLLLSKQSALNHIAEWRVGYIIAEKFWGMGYASEMISGLCHFADESGKVEIITGGVDPTNVGSAKVLIKNGFTKDSLESTLTTHFYKYYCVRRTNT